MTTTARRRLVLADDHPIVLDGLEHLFRTEPDLEVAAKCRDGVAALEAVRRLRPDVLVLDVRMPRRTGLDVLRELAGAGLPTRVVLLTAAVDEEELTEAVRLGVAGVVLKEMAPRNLVAAVRRVSEGGEWFDEDVSGRALRRLVDREAGREEAAELLTPREVEMVRMVASGLRNRAMAEHFQISEGTVKTHLHNVYEKLGLESRLELATYARKKGLI